MFIRMMIEWRGSVCECTVEREAPKRGVWCDMTQNGTATRVLEVSFFFLIDWTEGTEGWQNRTAIPVYSTYPPEAPVMRASRPLILLSTGLDMVCVVVSWTGHVARLGDG